MIFMILSGQNETGQKPVVRLLTAMEQAPTQTLAPQKRFRFKIPIFGDVEAEGTLGIAGSVTALMILAVAVVVLAHLGVH
jgi:hypothetical protein